MCVANASMAGHLCGRDGEEGLFVMPSSRSANHHFCSLYMAVVRIAVSL